MRSAVIVSLVLLVAACGGTGTPSTEGADADTSGGSASTENLPEGTNSPVWDEARARGVDFRGIGQEPGWVLEIAGGDSLRFRYDYGTSEVAAVAPDPEVSADETRTYRADTDAGALTATVIRTPCTDTMSGEAFESTVQVTFGGRTYAGCGRWLNAP